MIAQTLNTERGVTLLEVLVAMILTSLGLMMLLHMGMIALDGNDWSNRTTQATQAVQQKFEQLRAAGVPALQSGSDSAGGLARTWRVTSAGTHLRKVEVEVAWSDLKSRRHVNTLKTLIRTDSL
jgi:prepilin-type N-terminal cleavage/methylation domain-containing protein